MKAMESGLKEQCVLITGASGGIGGAIARAFAAEGARLVLHYHTQERAAAELRDGLDVSAVAIRADLRDAAQVDGLFAEALQTFPKLDVVVVNAGIWVSASVPLHEMTVAQWRQTQDADLTSAFLTCRAFLRHLRDVPRAAAAIVLIGSTAALLGEADHADYSAAKAAMVYGLTRTLKNEIVRLAPRGRVNCVCPGWTRTPMAAGLADDSPVMQRVQATIALKKIAVPEDVAAAVVCFWRRIGWRDTFSGAIVPVSGGMEGRVLHSWTSPGAARGAWT